jgi:hypothetical protein
VKQAARRLTAIVFSLAIVLAVGLSTMAGWPWDPK